MAVHGEADSYSNKRRYPRVPLRARCWCEADGVTLYARILNVSEGGVFIHTFAPLRQGTPARLRFAAGHGAQEIAAEAEVVWVRSSNDPHGMPGMGLRFLNIDEHSCQGLREVISRARSRAD